MSGPLELLAALPFVVLWWVIFLVGGLGLLAIFWPELRATGAELRRVDPPAPTTAETGGPDA